MKPRVYRELGRLLGDHPKAMADSIRRTEAEFQGAVEEDQWKRLPGYKRLGQRLRGEIARLSLPFHVITNFQQRQTVRRIEHIKRNPMPEDRLSRLNVQSAARNMPGREGDQQPGRGEVKRPQAR